MTVKISNVVALAIATAHRTFIDSGATSKLIIYDGVAPAGPETALGGGNRALVTFNLLDPAFAAAADANPGGRIALNPPPDVAAAFSGDAVFFRILIDATAHYQGTVGEPGSGADLIITEATLVATKIVSVISFAINQPEQ